MTVPKILQAGSINSELKSTGELVLHKHEFSQRVSPLEKMRDWQSDFSWRTPQRLVSILIDISDSMQGTPIQQVNRGAADFAVDCCRDVLTRDSLQVQLVTFGDHVTCYPFVPIARLTPPTFHAAGLTPMAEAILAAITETERYQEVLQQMQVEPLKPPHYFLFSDGQPNPSSLLAEAAACIRRQERNREGAFYGFGVDQAAVAALQPYFVREVQLLSGQHFAEFFRIISASVRYVSSRCVCEDIDLTPLIKESLRLGHEDGNHA
jgi:uncharacterized protein YegL